jgi:hypothetical protein
VYLERIAKGGHSSAAGIETSPRHANRRASSNSLLPRCPHPASLPPPLPCLGALANSSPAMNSNSENASSRAAIKLPRISNFRFSNSELLAACCATLALHQSLLRLTTHQPLPETANRVEIHVSHRKQTVAHASTRHSSHQSFRAPSLPRKHVGGPHHLPITAVLIDTRERLETGVSYRKQTIEHASARHSSRPDIPLRHSLVATHPKSLMIGAKFQTQETATA